LLAQLGPGANSGFIADAVSEYIADKRRRSVAEQLDELIRTLDEKLSNPAQTRQANPRIARPRIIACIGPDSPSRRMEDQARAILFRLCLSVALSGHGGVRIVDRESLQDVLREIRLSSSAMSHGQARLAVGELLPANLVLPGHLMPMKDDDEVYVRLIDVESTQVVHTHWQQIGKGATLEMVCRELADDIVKKAVESRPLQVRIFDAREDVLEAGIGAFHGVREGAVFHLVERTSRSDAHPLAYNETTVGTAEITDLGP